MHSFLVLLKKDLLEIKRSSKWIIYILTFIFVTVLSVATARVLPEVFNLLFEETGLDGLFTYEVSVADSYLQYVANIGEICLLLIMIMFSTSLIKEKSNGTYYLLKNNGISDWKIVISHFVSKFILITVSYLISIAVFIPLNLLVFNEYTGYRGVISLTYLYISLIFALSVALFVSSFCKKKSSAYAIAIVVYFTLTLLSAIPYIDVYNPLYSLILASNIMTEVDYKQSDYIMNIWYST